MEKREILKETELFVLDMDGTFYLDTDVLDGALDFLEEVKKAGKRYVFFTNNSSKSPKTYIDKLAKMGCYIKRNQIITSGNVMIQYLKEYYPEKKVYLVGTPDLEENFRENGILLTREMPDVVVIGFDMTLTYEKLERACTYIRNGAVFLATHLDINCPTKDGFIPDCGAMCAAISLSTGKEPKYVGKPFKETVDMVLEMTGAKREAMSFVGDRIYGCENRCGKWGTRNPGADRRDEAGGCTEGGCRAGCDFHRAERDGRNTQDYERRGSIE